VIDAIAAGAGILLGASLAAGDHESSNNDEVNYWGDGDLGGTFGGLMMAAGALSAISAIYGYHEVTQCTALRDAGPPLPP
jgi:hypothetical protein